MKITTSKQVSFTILTLINSCVEGYTGEWDCTTSEGRDGFLAMKDSLEELAAFLEINTDGCKDPEDGNPNE